MSVFQGGSAYNMAQSIADGYIITTELTFKQFKDPDFQTFLFEADRLLREIRGNPAARRRRHGDAEPAAEAAAAPAGDHDRQQRPEPPALSASGSRRASPAEMALAAAVLSRSRRFCSIVADRAASWPTASRTSGTRS